MPTASVCNNGGLGSFGAGIMSSEELEQNIILIKKLTKKPFLVNLFAPEKFKMQHNDCITYQLELNKYRKALGIKTKNSIENLNIPDINLNSSIDIILKYNIRLISFHFGIPNSTIIKKLKRSNVILLASANNLVEAKILVKSGIDIVIAQGIEAGGHQGGFLESSIKYKTEDLINIFAKHLSVPIIAAGGIMTGKDIKQMLNSGAVACQLGTAFLTVNESGAPDSYKKYLLKLKDNPNNTILTNIYSGRLPQTSKLARCMKNKFITEMEKKITEVPYFPLPLILSADVRTKASEIGNKDFMSIWCGENAHKIKKADSAKEILSILHSEMK